jgi:Na+:H+ antiporter, NhaA family
LLWFLMLKSGVHATMAGVMLAFAIPFSSRGKDRESPSHTLENFLGKPVALLVLPAFALANAGVVIPSAWLHGLTDGNSLGIIAGLLIGKPLGIVAFSLAATTAGICQLPRDVGWAHMVGAGLLGGIGFTMSIFIANLAFAGNPEVINSSKMAVLAASFAASLLGYLWFRFFGRQP